MTAQIMAECLEEARGLWEALTGDKMVEVEEDGRAFWNWTQEIATLAAALYQARCRQANVTEVGEEEPRRAYPWRYPVPSGTQTAKPMVCPDCSQVWTEGHLCTAAGSRGTTWWPAP